MGNISFDPRRQVLGGFSSKEAAAVASNGISNGLARGLNVAANNVQRAVNNLVDDNRRDQRLTAETRMIGLKDNIRSLSDQFIQDKLQDDKFVSLDKKSQNEAFAEYLRPHIEKGVDGLGLMDEAEIELERAKLGSIVSANNAVLHSELKRKRINDAQLAFSQESKSISNMAFDNPDELYGHLEELGGLGEAFSEGLGNDKARAMIEKDAGSVVRSAIKGFVNQRRYEDAEKLLNGQGSVDISSLIGGEERANLLDFTDRAREAEIRRIERELKKKLEADKIATYSSIYSSGLMQADPKDREAVKFISAQYEKDAATWEPKDMASNTVNVALRTGIVPDGVKSFWRSAAYGTPEQQYTAAEIFNAIDAKAPHVIERSGVDKTTQARYRLIGSMTKAGIDPNTVIKRANDLVNPENRTLREAREKIFSDKEFKKITAADVTDFFDTPMEWEATILPEQIPALEEEVNGLYRREFLLTGDADHAKEYALKNSKRTWGVTNADGTKRLIKYPPENYYGLGDGNDDWISEQLHADLQAGGYTEEDAKPILFSTVETAHTAGEGKPAYRVMFLKDGALEAGPLWRPDPSMRKQELVLQAANERMKHKPDEKLLEVKVKGQDKPIFMLQNSKTFRLKDPVSGQPLNFNLDQKVGEFLSDKYYSATSAFTAMAEVGTTEKISKFIEKDLSNMFEVKSSMDSDTLSRFLKGGLAGVFFDEDKPKRDASDEEVRDKTESKNGPTLP